MGRWFTWRCAGLLVLIAGLALLVRWCVAGVEIEILDYTVDRRDPTVVLLAVKACGEGPYRVQVEESVDVVRITVRRQHGRGGSGDDCADGVDVQLDGPLDDRLVVDGATGRLVRSS